MRRHLAALVLVGSFLAGVPAAPSDAANPVDPYGSGIDSDLHFGIAESWRYLSAAVSAGASWDRLVLSWQHLEPSPGDWWAHRALPDEIPRKSRQAGLELVGLLQDTAPWGARDPEAGWRSPPRGLDYPWDDPRNLWGSYTYRLASEYRGTIDHWIVWNEPEFRPTDQGGLYSTWAGRDEEFYRLLKVAYQAIKAANPQARILFPSTSYWIDAVNGREQFLARILAIAARDPEAPANGYFFDGVPLNLYWAPEDLLTLANDIRAILWSYGVDKPLWITETNAMPYDDPVTPKPRNGQRVTLDVQASFAIQAYALAIAAGYERVAWHAMIDRDTSDEIWGLARNDGSFRPAFRAYQVAATYFSRADRVTFKSLPRPPSQWLDPIKPAWRIHLVAFDRGDQRVTVLWNMTDRPERVRILRRGTSAQLVDKVGRISPLEEAPGGGWVVRLEPASARGPFDPDGFYFVGGDPMLIVERGVPPKAPVSAPEVLS